MIVEGLILGAVVAKAFGLVTIGKVAFVKKMIEGRRKEISMPTPSGPVRVWIDEFIGQDGELVVQISALKTGDGEVVITQAEKGLFVQGKILRDLEKMGILEGIRGEDIPRLLSPLMESLKEKEEEIKRSPSRRARRG